MTKKHLQFMFKMIYELAITHMFALYKDEMYASEHEWNPAYIYDFVLNEIDSGRLIDESSIISYVAMNIERFLDDEALEEVMLIAIDTYNENITA